jgi:hypothetical protein
MTITGDVEAVMRLSEAGPLPKNPECNEGGGSLGTGTAPEWAIIHIRTGCLDHSALLSSASPNQFLQQAFAPEKEDS